MKNYANYKSPWILLILLVIGGILGSILGQLMSSFSALSFLNEGRVVGLPPATLNLEVLAITLGFTFKVNLLSLLGFIFAFYVYRRM